MTNKQLTWLFVGLALLIGGSAVWYFFFRDECDPNKDGYTKKGKLSDKCKAKDPAIDNTPPPAGTSQWIKDDTFPLKKGMWGSRVRGVQEKLGITADEKFGSGTEAAVYARFKENTVSEPNYNALINPAAIGGGSNFQELKKTLGALAKNFSGGVSYSTPGQNENYRFDFFTNGRLFLYQQSGGPVVKKGTYSNGGKKMVVDGGNSYENSVFANTRDIVKDYGK